MPDNDLATAITSIKAGNKALAQQILVNIVKVEPRNDAAWLWLSTCLDSIEQKKTCISKALEINPQNIGARKALEHLSTNTPSDIPLPSLSEITSTRTKNNTAVTLSCPTCGGKLQITDDLERFACQYCGNEHIVRRNAGTISLAPITEGLRKVQVGVDRTASELAIRRVSEEIDTLKSKRSELIASQQNKLKSINEQVAHSEQMINNLNGLFFLALFGLIGSILLCSLPVILAPAILTNENNIMLLLTVLSLIGFPLVLVLFGARPSARTHSQALEKYKKELSQIKLDPENDLKDLDANLKKKEEELLKHQKMVLE